MFAEGVGGRPLLRRYLLVAVVTILGLELSAIFLLPRDFGFTLVVVLPLSVGVILITWRVLLHSSQVLAQVLWVWVLSWRRFTVRTLVIMVTLVCFFLGVFHERLHREFALHRLDQLSAETSRGFYLRLRYRGAVESARPLPWWQRCFADNSRVVMDMTLHGKAVADNDVALFKRFPSLERLSLFDSGITDRGIQELSELKQIRFLVLYQADIGDRSAESLATMTGLFELNLHGTRITDAGLRRLMSLKNLKYLDIAGTACTDLGVLALQAELPNCTIFQAPIGSYCPAQFSDVNGKWSDTSSPTTLRLHHSGKESFLIGARYIDPRDARTVVSSDIKARFVSRTFTFLLDSPVYGIEGEEYRRLFPIQLNTGIGLLPSTRLHAYERSDSDERNDLLLAREL